MSQNTDMKKSGIPLFKLVGFQISLDWSWFFLAILITWSLTAGYFPHAYPGMTSLAYLFMGIAGSLGLFLSLILHEFCHSIVGRYYGMPILGIKLFIFGGIAELGENPKSPKAEFLMAAAGPLFSIVFAIVLHFLFLFFSHQGISNSINGVISYLSMINFALGIFNMLPGFPLDGGRVLRSLLWWWKNDLKWATKIASGVGRFLGFFMIFMGILLFIQGGFISGIWMGLIGLYLQSISKSSYDQIILDEIFHDIPIKKYTKTNPITVTSNMTLQELVETYFYTHFHKLYPVVDQDILMGSISFSEIKATPNEMWKTTTVGQVMKKMPSDIVIEAQTPVLQVMQIMNVQQTGRLIVIEDHKLYGIITLKDLMDIFSIRKELESKE